jgi:cell division septation protein DedD
MIPDATNVKIALLFCVFKSRLIFSFTLVASGIIVLALFSIKHNHLSMDVIDILNRAGIIVLC